MSACLIPAVELLPMNERDLDEVLRIEIDVYAFPWSRGNFLDSINAGYSCWVCRSVGELVGYAVIMHAVDDAHLLNVSVAARRQGKGFGARLLAHALQVGRELGASTLLLEVRPSNVKAVGLYKAFGFQQIGVRRGYYPAHVGREDALVLTKALAEVSA